MAASNDPLLEAIKNNNLEEVIKILREETLEQERLGIALIEAVRKENAGMVESLLSANAPLGLVNIGDEKTSTALHVASQLGHLAIVETLFNMGANPNLRDNDNIDALHRASCNGHIPVIAKLLDSGMDIESAGSEGETPLLYAIVGEQIDTVRFLLDRGANVNASNSGGYSCLMFACSAVEKTADLAIIRLLIEKGADIEAKASESCKEKGFTPLMYAVFHPDANTSATVVAELIAAGANLEARELRDGASALHLSIFASSSLAAFKLLLDAGANVQAVDNDGDTIWHYLGRYFNKENLDEWVELLLSTGVSINAKTSHGFTPLCKIIGRVTFDPSNEWDRMAPRALEIFLKAGGDAGANAGGGIGMLTILITNFHLVCCADPAQINEDGWQDKCRAAAKLIGILSRAGAMPTEDLDGLSPMRKLYKLMGEAAFNEHRNRLAPVLVALVSAGDYCFDLLPRNAPLPGLGAALIDVWRNNQAKLRYLFARLSSENQERVRLLLKCLRFGSLLGQGESSSENGRSIPEVLRIEIISYALAV